MEIGNFRWRRFLYMTIQYSVIPYDLNLHSQHTEKVWNSHLLQDKSSVLPHVRLFPQNKTVLPLLLSRSRSILYQRFSSLPKSTFSLALWTTSQIF